MYGAHKISNLEDLRKNERNQSEDTVTATIDPACEVAYTRDCSNLRSTNISISSWYNWWKTFFGQALYKHAKVKS